MPRRNYDNGPGKAATVSRVLKRAGFTPMPSQSTRDGRLTVRGSSDQVRITVDLSDFRTGAERLLRATRAVLAEHGFLLTETKTGSAVLDDGSTYAWASYYAERPEWSTPDDLTDSDARKYLAEVELTRRGQVTDLDQTLAHHDAHTVADLLGVLAAMTKGESISKFAAAYVDQLRHPAFPEVDRPDPRGGTVR